MAPAVTTPATNHGHNGDTFAAAASQRATGIVSYAQTSLDRVVPASTRQEIYDQAAAFAAARPVLFSFIVSQLLFSFMPVLLFTAFAASTVAFSLGAALVFALFWIGVAFMLLIPTLLLTASIAFLVWVWAVGSFLVARWLYTHAPFGGPDGQVAKDGVAVKQQN